MGMDSAAPTSGPSRNVRLDHWKRLPRSDASLGGADARVGGGHGAFGGGDVGAAFQQRGRQAGRNRQRDLLDGLRRHREVGRGAAQQHGQRVFGRGAAAVDAECFRLRGGKFGLGARQVQFADVAGVVAALDQLQGVRAQLDRLVVQLRFGVLFAHQEVRGGHVGLQGQQHRTVQRFALLGVGGGGVGGGCHAAEQVRFIRHRTLGAPRRHRAGGRAVGQALGDGRRALAVGAEGRIQRGEEAGAGLALQGTRLRQAGGSGLQVLVGVRRAARLPTARRASRCRLRKRAGRLP
ncbi:hypothetical protein G6F35_013263 [Rhizopus arrhizus]|nr:hypothetical protein G6F35_013263 [Rhizopus arrhizus]